MASASVLLFLFGGFLQDFLGDFGIEFDGAVRADPESFRGRLGEFFYFREPYGEGFALAIAMDELERGRAVLPLAKQAALPEEEIDGRAECQ